MDVRPACYEGGRRFGLRWRDEDGRGHTDNEATEHLSASRRPLLGLTGTTIVVASASLALEKGLATRGDHAGHVKGKVGSHNVSCDARACSGGLGIGFGGYGWMDVKRDDAVGGGADHRGARHGGDHRCAAHALQCRSEYR